MSKLAHSNQETMDQIEAQAIADEEAGKHNRLCSECRTQDDHVLGVAA